ncbi:MAG: SAM-dependent methyltransferase [Paludibacter sp.]|nr:SAM-dependent methyltransferase [Paludibacter sp.]
MDTQTKLFIQEHLNDDVIQLGLQAKRYPDIDTTFVINQIAGLQKIKEKVPLFYVSDNLLFPKQLSVEQSSSEITAKYKSELFHGNAFADLSGGFGVDFYFISKNFRSGFYVERDDELCKLAAHNFEVLNIPQYEIHQINSEEYLENMQEVDLIYIDPHRRSKTGNKTVLISDCEPDVTLLAEKMLLKSPVVMIKLSPMLDIHQAIKHLPQTEEVHIVAVDNECKEVLLILNRKWTFEPDENQYNNIIIKTRNLHSTKQEQIFDFTYDKEKQAEPIFTDEVGHYLYEPNAAIMKSGAFKSVATRFNLRKFHVNTHLYTGEYLIDNFPGRIMQVSEVYGNTKSDLKIIKAKYPKANVSTRNYPLSVDDFRKKTGIKDGGKDYLFALKTTSDKNIIIICNKIN